MIWPWGQKIPPAAVWLGRPLVLQEISAQALGRAKKASGQAENNNITTTPAHPRDSTPAGPLRLRLKLTLGGATTHMTCLSRGRRSKKFRAKIPDLVV